jgi:LmbE family N-acetylglucosaminyl deacetylase
MAAVMSDRMIEGDGTPENVWSQWPGLASTPCAALDEWLPVHSRLVVVAPHPDDEILSCGALLQMHSKAGGSVLLVAVTDGEASHAGSSIWNSEALGEARRAESYEGLAHLLSSAPEVVRMELPDGSVTDHVDELQTKLGELLQPSDLVVTTWRRDGHPDHEATGSAAANACAAVGSRIAEAPVWMWHWAQPADRRVPWGRLRGLAASPEALNHKRLAIAAHVTQLVPRDTGEGPVLSDNTLARLQREIEYFFV